jgi:hypothetical protein
MPGMIIAGRCGRFGRSHATEGGRGCFLGSRRAMPNVMNCVVDRRHRREADAEDEEIRPSSTDDGMKVRDQYFVRRQPKPADHEVLCTVLPPRCCLVSQLSANWRVLGPCNTAGQSRRELFAVDIPADHHILGPPRFVRSPAQLSPQRR